jgi:hypothetical protein
MQPAVRRRSWVVLGLVGSSELSGDAVCPRWAVAGWVHLGAAVSAGGVLCPLLLIVFRRGFGAAVV